MELGTMEPIIYYYMQLLLFKIINYKSVHVQRYMYIVHVHVHTSTMVLSIITTQIVAEQVYTKQITPTKLFVPPTNLQLKY